MANLDGPALMPPPGVIPNLVNPPNLRSETLGLTCTYIFITTVAVGLRTWTKAIVIKKLNLEDYLFVLVWAAFFAFLVVVTLDLPIGAGVHQWNVRLGNMHLFAKKANEADIHYSVIMLVLKAALTLQLIRIFTVSSWQKLYWLYRAVLAVNIIFYLFIIIFRIFACVPREKIWNPSIPGSCPNGLGFYLVSAAYNATSDLVLLALTIAQVWSLQISLRKKWAISAVFAAGTFGCVASVMRVVALANMIKSRDLTFHILVNGLWCFTELTCGIFCGCLPVLPRFYREYAAPAVTHIVSQMRISHNRRNASHIYSSDTSKTLGSDRFQKSIPADQTYIELRDTVNEAR